MAKFNFRLQSVLTVKEKIEDLKKNEFGKAVMELEIERQKKAELERKRVDCINGFRESIMQGVNPLEIQRYNLFIDKLKHLIKLQEQAIIKAQAWVEKKRAELVEAMRDRKTLDALKENDFEEFLVEEKKAEQKVVDEIVSYRTACLQKQ